MQEPTKSALFLISVFLCLFYFLTSGILFELMVRTGSSGIDIPYSIGISNNRINLSGSFTGSDDRALEWLGTQDGAYVWTDYNGAVLIHTTELWGRFSLNAWPVAPESASYYLFITSWSGKNNKFVFGRIPGIRWLADIPSTKGMELVYVDGYTKIYRTVKYLEGST